MTSDGGKTGSRRPARRAMREFYLELRRTREGPAPTAAAVFVGTVIGCLPIYGLHLASCVLVSRFLRLSATTTYLAAHVNNPFTAPFIVALSIVLGRIVLPLSERAPPESGLAGSAAQLGAQVVVGALILGVGLGSLLAVAAFVAGRRWSAPARVVELRRRGAQRFMTSGVRHWEFARAKLRYDPMYLYLAELPLVRRAASLVDLGCGRGILLAAVAEAGRRGRNPHRRLVGIELDKRAAFVAGRALRGEATICIADLASTAVPAADVMVIADVLHYIPLSDQRSLLGRAVEALRPGGSLVIREADRDGGWRFQAIRLAERARAIFRGDWSQSFRYRSQTELVEELAALGLEVEASPMSVGTPFANVLIVGGSPAESEID